MHAAMDKWYGYAGTILYVDLSTGAIAKKPLTQELARTWLGGRGFNVETLWEHTSSETDPLGPENVLCFGFGPLTGTLFGSSARWSISAKSPQTGHLGDSNIGGHFACEAKYAGYDQIVFAGRSERPVYLWIADDRVELRDAAHIWGKDTWGTTDLLREEHGEEIQVACIGQAGENLVRTACVIGGYERAAGKCGMGAVMGSKQLKAVAIRGTRGVSIARPDEFEKLVKDEYRITMADQAYPYFSVYGTHMVFPKYATSDPQHNYQTFVPPPGRGKTHLDFIDRYTVRLKACAACPVHCSRFHEFRRGRYQGKRAGGPEYIGLEAIMRLGADLEAALVWVDNADKYGIDVLCTANSLGFAMELYQRGLITREDTGGIALEWGSVEAIDRMTEKLIRREGFGNVLAEGAHNMARIIGKGTERYVTGTKGLDGVGDVRYGIAQLAYLTSTKGFDHLRGIGHMPHQTAKSLFGAESSVSPVNVDDCSEVYYASPHGAAAAIYFEHLQALADSLPRCKLSRIGISNIWYPLLTTEEFSHVLSAATGLAWQADELWKAAERIYNLEQAFCAREGIRREHFYPSPRMSEPVPDGPRKGTQVTRAQWDELLDDYFKLREWDPETTIPTRRKLEGLGLKYVADELDRGVPYAEWKGPPLHKSCP